MSEVRRPRGRDIPLKINGTNKYIKGVTNHTTIGDVIKMVLRKINTGKEDGTADSYGIFESSRGIERMLPGKCKVMKMMRSWGSAENFEFVFRKVNPVVSMPKVSEAKRRKLTQRSRDIPMQTGSTQARYEKPAALAQLIHSQKLKLNRLDTRNTNGFVKEIYFNDTDNSMNEFIANVDRQKMAAFLDFCGSVTSDEINRLSNGGKRKLSSGDDVTNHVNKRHVLGQSRLVEGNSMVSCNNVTLTSNVNHVKYAVRKTLKPKTVSTAPMSPSRSTSTSGKQTYDEQRHVEGSSMICPPIIHSTPCLRQLKSTPEPRKRHERLANAITSQISKMSQKEGKDALLNKYFNDYINYTSPASRLRDSKFRGQGDGAETNVTRMRRSVGDGSEQLPLCRWHNTRTTAPVSETGSDSGQEEESRMSNFDEAFIEEIDDLEHNNISGICRLVDYSLSESDQSLAESPLHNSIASDVSEHTKPDIINYAESDVSSISDVVKNVFSDRKDNEDDDMESFMKTRLEDEFSDEGLSSLGSDDEKEILV